jgi:hypothetical protein
MHPLEHNIIQALVRLYSHSDLNGADPLKAYCENEAKFIATASSEADLDNYNRVWRTSASKRHFFLIVCTDPYISG